MTGRLIDVAKVAGVSKATVSRVFNDHPNVRPEVRARVRSAAEAVGFEPDYIGRSLRRQTTQSIGFVVRDISSPLFADIVKGAEGLFNPAGYTMLLANSGGDPELGATHIANLRRRKVDGLILSLESENDDHTNALLTSLDVPVVLLDRDHPRSRSGRSRMSSVICDHRSGVYAATTHLLELGHRHIAFCCAPLNIRPTRERVAGFEQAHLDAHIPVAEHALHIAGGHTELHGADVTDRLLAGARRPTALLCAGLQLTIGAIATLRRYDIELGAEMSLVTCDQASFLELIQPPVSRIERDRELIGSTAAALLLRMLQTEQVPRRRVVPTSYVARGTSRPPGSRA